MLLTAIAATAVILPWAIDRAARSTGGQRAGTFDRPAAADRSGRRRHGPRSHVSHAVLDGRADRWDLTGTTARVRAKRADGSWGPWYEAETVESGSAPGTADGPSGSASGPRGTDPVFVGTTTNRADRRHPPGRRAGDQGARRAPRPDQARLGYRPASVERAACRRTSRPY